MDIPTISLLNNTLTLTHNGETQHYPNDKMGKRQSILDGLQAIATKTAGADTYLHSDAAQQLVAAVLYPDGIQTEEAYQQVCRITDKALTFLGYGEEVTLGPPTVPFSERGSYRHKLPPVSTQLVLDELEGARLSGTLPRREIPCTIPWNQAGQAVYQRHWRDLTPGQQEQIRIQVDQIAQQAGWDTETKPNASLYIQPLAINAARAKEYLLYLLKQEAGAPLLHSAVVSQLQQGAYGRSFFSNDLPEALSALVTALLPAHGYQMDLVEGEYRPKPADLTLPDVESLAEKIAALPKVETQMGQALLLSDLLHSLAAEQTMSDWQKARLIQTSPLSHALLQIGFQTELTWCQPYQFVPEREDEWQATPVLLRAARPKNDPDRTIQLAAGLPVYTPGLVVDNEDNTLVYLEMVGVKEAVKANWATLMGGNRVHWLVGQRIQMEGMKQHILVPASLPCGWVSQVLIHKQASLKAMNPEQPFYLLDNDQQPIPSLFYPMLNKALPLPLLATWQTYLWTYGKDAQLITLVNEGQGQQYAAWRILPDLAAWQTLVQTGLQRATLHF